MLQAHLYFNKGYMKANESLKKYNKSYWKKHKKWINQYLAFIRELIDASSDPYIVKLKQK